MAIIRSRAYIFTAGLLVHLLLLLLLTNHTHAVAEHALQSQERAKITLESRLVDEYAPDRALLTVRAETYTIDANNSPNRGNVSSSQSSIWRYPSELLTAPLADSTDGLPSNLFDIAEKSVTAVHPELRKREHEEVDVHAKEQRQSEQRTAYISMNTCSQPVWSGNGTQVDAPPQLRLYVGQSGNASPGPGSAGQQLEIILDQGIATAQVKADSDIYMVVAAPTLGSEFRGGWTYDIAVSTNDYYHAAEPGVSFLYLVDTDTTSALLVTDNLTQANPSDNVFKQWMNMQELPFTIFANPVGDTRRMGLAYSYCGLEAVKQIGGAQAFTTGPSPYVNRDMITRGLGNKPKQQFMVGNLTRGTSYNATLALIGNGAKSGKGVVGGGGTVWYPTSWTTKVDGNCQVLYNLPFCDEVAYAAPSNPSNYNTTALSTLYDGYASQLYQNFSYSLQQMSCNTTNDERYSLARTCDDCAKAYKQWLCAVTIPRCEDFSNNASFLQPRNVGQKFFQNQSLLPDEILYTPYQPMPGAPTLPGTPMDQTWISAFATNQSRNPAVIDIKVAPGPYKEVLPCEDLCHSLIQSCPAALQFSCPLPGRGLEAGYGKRPASQTVVECSYLGAVYYIDAATHSAPRTASLVVIAIMVAFFIS